MSQLDDIKARAEKATEGPWEAVGAANIVPPHGPNIGRITRQADQSFVAHARTDVPKLVAALEAVQEIVAKLRAIQQEENVSKNACAGGVANVLEEVIEEALS